MIERNLPTQIGRSPRNPSTFHLSASPSSDGNLGGRARRVNKELPLPAINVNGRDRTNGATHRKRQRKRHPDEYAGPSRLDDNHIPSGNLIETEGSLHIAQESRIIGIGPPEDVITARQRVVIEAKLDNLA